MYYRSLTQSEYICLKEKKFYNLNNNVISYLKERNFLFDSLKEYISYKNNLKEKFIMQLQTNDKFFLTSIPTSNCNFKCDYCYQKDLSQNDEYSFDYSIEFLNNNLEILNKDVEVTILGGEALQLKYKNKLKKYISFLNETKIKYNIITNGYELDKFIDILVKFNCNNIQITIDGDKQIHNERRKHSLENDTFTKIFKNIQLALENGLSISVRCNIDKDNINIINDLEYLFSDFINNEKFYLYIYTMQCGGNNWTEKIIDEIEVMKKYYSKKRNKNFGTEFHGQRMIDAILFDRKFKPKIIECAAFNNSAVILNNGLLAKCWFGFDKDGFTSTLNNFNNFNDKWLNRNIYNNKKCEKCKFKYICGGGCISNINLKDESLTNYSNCVDYSKILSFIIEKRCDYNEL